MQPSGGTPSSPGSSALANTIADHLARATAIDSGSVPDPEWFDALGTLVGRALAEHDQEALTVADRSLADLVAQAAEPVRSRLDGVRLVLASSNRKPSSPAADPTSSTGTLPGSSTLEPGSLAARMLRSIVESPDAANRDLARMLGTDETQISRAGRHLLDLGLLVRVKRGRVNRWIITPRGETEARGDRPDRPGREALPARARRGTGDDLLSIVVDPTASEAARIDASRDLVARGVVERRAVGPRGSLVQGAFSRTDAEGRLVNAFLTARGDLAVALAAVLGEWGSATATEALAAHLMDTAAAEDPALRIALLTALGRLGGPSAARTLATLLTTSTDDHLAIVVVGLVSELITGGRADSTGPVDTPRRSSRWLTTDRRSAIGAAREVSSALEHVDSTTAAPYLRLSARQVRTELHRWLQANNIRLDDDDSAEQPGDLPPEVLSALLREVEEYVAEFSGQPLLVTCGVDVRQGRSVDSRSGVELPVPRSFRDRLGPEVSIAFRRERDRLVIDVSPVTSELVFAAAVVDHDEVLTFRMTRVVRPGHAQLELPWARAAFPDRIHLGAWPLRTAGG